MGCTSSKTITKSTATYEASSVQMKTDATPTTASDQRHILSQMMVSQALVFSMEIWHRKLTRAQDLLARYCNSSTATHSDRRTSI